MRDCSYGFSKKPFHILLVRRNTYLISLGLEDKPRAPILSTVTFRWLGIWQAFSACVDVFSHLGAVAQAGLGELLRM